MNNTKINYAAVAIAAVPYWLLGAAWFTILSRQWLAGVGKTVQQLRQQGGSPAVPYVIALVCNLIFAYVLAWVIAQTGDQSAARGVKLGALVWLGFVATAMATEYVFEARSLQFFAITAGYPLVGAWKK